MQGTVTMNLEVKIRTKPAGVSGQGCAKGVATELWAGQRAVVELTGDKSKPKLCPKSLKDFC